MCSVEVVPRSYTIQILMGLSDFELRSVDEKKKRRQRFYRDVCVCVCLHVRIIECVCIYGWVYLFVSDTALCRRECTENLKLVSGSLLYIDYRTCICGEGSKSLHGREKERERVQHMKERESIIYDLLQCVCWCFKCSK